MKTIILLSLLMVGCILEPVPEEEILMAKDLHGKWVSADYQTVYIEIQSYTIDTILSNGVTGIATLKQYEGTAFSDRRYTHIGDTLKINYLDFGHKFVRKRHKLN
jgi:hypothetical protein